MSGGRYNVRRTRRVWRVEGEKRGVGERPADGKDGEGDRKTSAG